MLHPRRPQSGFTLAEIAITIALVALTLSVMLQVLQGSQLTTAHTRDTRIARDLALRTLAEIETGQRWDDIEELHGGTYADLDYPQFAFELAIGDESFRDVSQDEEGRPFDNWAYREERERELAEDSDEEEEEELTEPFEKVRIRVTFPKYRDLPSELVLERWIPWEQVYGAPEEEEGEEEAGGAEKETAGGAGATDTGGANGGPGGGGG